MDKNQFITKTFKGALRAVIITIIMILVLSVVMTFVDLDAKVASITILVITVLSVMYGAIYSAKNINEKGWLVGMLVALCYMIMVYIIGAIFYKDLGMDLGDWFRLIVAVLVGSLSGMLGINI